MPVQFTLSFKKWSPVLINLGEFFIYYGRMSFSGYAYCSFPLPVCNLPSSSSWSLLMKEILDFSESQYFNFFFLLRLVLFVCCLRNLYILQGDEDVLLLVFFLEAFHKIFILKHFQTSRKAARI